MEESNNINNENNSNEDSNHNVKKQLKRTKHNLTIDEILKSQKPTYIEYKSNTFNNSSGSDSFKWKVE